MKKEIIGIDVSKLTIDVWLHLARAHKCFKNGPSGFLSMLKWVQKLSKSELSDLSFCFEHTGLYSYALRQFLHDKNVCYFIVSGLMVKRTLGLTRGKSDRVDASNLARFAFLHKEELKPYVMPSKDILRLKELLSFRNKLVRQVITEELIFFRRNFSGSTGAILAKLYNRLNFKASSVSKLKKLKNSRNSGYFFCHYIFIVLNSLWEV